MFGSQSDSFDWDAALDSYGVVDDMLTRDDRPGNNTEQQLDSRHASSSDEYDMDTIDSAVTEQDSKVSDVKLAAQDEEFIVAEWEKKTRELLNEIFTITRDIKISQQSFEKELADLDHKIELTQLKFDLSAQAMRNHFLSESRVEMGTAVKAGPIADASADTRYEEATSAKSGRVSFRSHLAGGSSSSSDRPASTLAAVQGPENNNSSRSNDEIPSRIDLLMATAAAPAPRTRLASGHDGSAARMGGIARASAPIDDGQQRSSQGASTQIASSSSRATRTASVSGGQQARK